MNRDPRSMADTFRVESRARSLTDVGCPWWYRNQQMDRNGRCVGIGVPNKTQKTREKNARTARNRADRASKGGK